MRVATVLFPALIIGSSFAQQPDPSVVFHSQTREVLLEVIVRDSHGKLVTKIDPSQVSVYEDGVKQDIRSFRLVTGREVRAADEKQVAEAAAPQNALAFGSLPPSNPLRTVNLVCLVMNDLNPETRAFALDAARKFVNRELRPDTYIGIFGLDSSGLRPVFPFSNNRERLLKAIELASINRLPAFTQSVGAMLNGVNMPTPGVSPQLDPGSAGNPLGTKGSMESAVIAGLREIDSLLRLVNQLSQLPFQKTVLLMSTGLTRPPDQLEYWKSLITAANKGGVTFYGLDVYGLGVCQDSPGDCKTSSTPTDAAAGFVQMAATLSQSQSTVGLPPRGPNSPGGSSTQGPSAAQQSMAVMHQMDFMRFGVLSANTQEALRELSESTGGFIIANTNNVDPLLARVMDDVDTHYELAYRPESSASDGHFRKIEVKLGRSDLRVETRTGYFAVPDTGQGPLTSGDVGALQALDAKPLPHAFDFGSKAFRFRPGKESTQYAITFEVPIANLTSTAEAEQKKHRYHAYLLALVKNSHGEIVQRISRDVPSDIPDEALPALRNDKMIFEHAINLGPGHYTVETAVVDQEGNRSSANVFQIDNGDQPGPQVSDVVLVRRAHDLERAPDASDPFEGPGSRLQPFVSSALPDVALPSIYFVVYPQEQGAAEVITLQTQFLRNGRILSTQSSTLPQPDASGAVPMTIQPAAYAGDYEVRITVQQGNNSVLRSLKYSIAAK